MRTIADNGRANYFKERRGKFKAFHAEVERNKMEEFEHKLGMRKQTKKEWLDEKIDEELKK